MRHELKLDPLEPVYHTITAANLVLRDLNVEELVSPRSHGALRAAYQNLPDNGEMFELKNLMASIATGHIDTLNQSEETRASVTSRCVQIIEEARRLCE